ncbi:hypothetical protein Hanom_Chr01g00037321 [Helianthus anomalus]
MAQFRWGRKWHRWSVTKLGRTLGIYTDEEINTEIFTNIYKFRSDQQRADFWAQVADGPPYEVRKAKTSRLRDPLLRVLHQVMRHTICGRMDSSGNYPTPDVLFLCSIVNRLHVNLAARMAEFFLNIAGWSTSSEIHGGEYVTQLAHSLGVMTDEVVNGLTLVHVGGEVDLRSLKSMGLVVDTQNVPRLRGLNGEIRHPLPPLPHDEDEDV